MLLATGNDVRDRQQKLIKHEGTVDQDLTVIITGNKLTTNKKLVKVHTLESCLIEGIDN